jgi:hypothetical protein
MSMGAWRSFLQRDSGACYTEDSAPAAVVLLTRLAWLLLVASVFVSFMVSAHTAELVAFVALVLLGEARAAKTWLNGVHVERERARHELKEWE